jgi:ribose transport system permease protein
MTNKLQQPVNFKLIGNFVMEYLVLFAILTLVITTAVVRPEFLTPQNLINLMRQFGPLSFVALGMTFIIMGGFIDLSVPGMIGVVGVVTLSLVESIGEIPALITGLAVGVLMGSINGTVLVVSGASTQAKALFITFGMSQIYLSAARLYTGGAAINRNFFEHPMPITISLGSGMVGFLSVSFVLFLFCLFILFVFERKTFYGRSITYTGGNIVAAELGGLPTKRVMIMIYAICGIMAAISAIVIFSRVPVFLPGDGRNFERDAIMAVVVGGTSLFGGKGSVLRTVLGVSLVVLMSNCMNLLGVPSHLQEVLRGAILVTAIWLDHRRHQ